MKFNTNEELNNYRKNRRCQRCGESKYRIIGYGDLNHLGGYSELCANCDNLLTEG